MAGNSNGSFDEGIQYLMDAVGDGDIVAGVFVDQPYAQDQHETPYYHRAGQMRYLGEPLLENAMKMVSDISQKVITEDGSGLSGVMRQTSEDMAGFVVERAPLDTGRLRESPSPYVVDNGVETYRRPPVAPRDSDQLPRGGR